jgi:tetratricopeptide (TPR) repeat protein
VNIDISSLLKEWEYDSENMVRLVRLGDGRQVMQVRSPLGIEQYELDNRPDGLTRFGRASVLDEVKHRLEQFVHENLSDSGFEVDADMFAELQNESLLYYSRYLLLFEIGDYERATRDTDHNLIICSLVEKYCEYGDEVASLLQYKPYILRVNALSRAMILLNQDERDDAVEIIENAMQTIRDLPDIETTIFQFERMRSLGHLKETLNQVNSQQDSAVGRLEAELVTAVESENYERAVELRDEIAVLRESDGFE